ncbi:DUF5050 domain-containing protein [Bdellovibrio sp. 22V]|uniref:DUF5050 domain-containing protein n=1 Tax=Bdellovibrio TaxID=958 RepID=UPI0025438B91|nr:DUF5050 domain-containing protein [Bdellovibrio sp. 22V]WII70873.1 DUF5050 domain-containing protein [Bdellovibrio sp. 22V]
MKFYRHVLYAILSLLGLSGCSLDASLKSQLLSQVSSERFKLTPERDLVFTEQGTLSFAVNTTPLFSPSAVAPAVSTAQLKVLADVTVLATPALVDDIKPLLRPERVDVGTEPLSIPPIPDNFETTPVAFRKSSSLSGVSSFDQCSLTPLLPGAECSFESVSVPLEEIETGALTFHFDQGEDAQYETKRYKVSRVSFGALTSDISPSFSARESGVAVLDNEYYQLSSDNSTYLKTSPTTFRKVYQRSSNYDFLKEIARFGDYIYFHGYKPNVDYTGLYVMKADFSEFRLVANIRTNASDLSMFGNYEMVLYRGKLYFTLYEADFRSKLFRMNPDGTGVEKISNFVSGAADGIFMLKVYNDKLYFTANVGSTPSTGYKLFYLTTDEGGDNLAIYRFPNMNATGYDIGGIYVVENKLYVVGTTSLGSGVYRISSDHSTWTRILETENYYTFEFVHKSPLWLAAFSESFSDSRYSFFLFNPTNEQFTLLSDLDPDGTTYNIAPENFVLSADRIYFAASTEGMSALMSTNYQGGDLKVHALDVSVDDRLAILGDRVFFTAENSSFDKDIYSINAKTGEGLQRHTNMGSWGWNLTNQSMYQLPSSELIFVWSGEMFMIEFL